MCLTADVPTPPQLYDATFYVNATSVGPFSFPTVLDNKWVYTNRNRYPLKWSIFAGQPNPPMFAIDPKNGTISVLAPGITWSSQLHTYTLFIKLEADGILSGASPDCPTT